MLQILRTYLTLLLTILSTSCKQSLLSSFVRSTVVLCLLALWPLIIKANDHRHPFTIMLNPSGTTQITGRLIDTHFERSIALYAAEALKQQLEESDPDYVVIITRKPGQATNALQNAHFANSLNVDLFLSLHFYQETDIKPHIYLYQYSYNNTITPRPSDFTFYRYDQSYLFNRKSSARAAQTFLRTWSHEPHVTQFTTHQPIAMPCASLIGIISPALALDIGIKKHTDWHATLAPLHEALIALKKERHASLSHRDHLP